MLIYQKDSLSCKSYMDECRNLYLCQDVGEVFLKSLLHLGYVDFLLKGMVNFVSEEVRIIVSLITPILEISEHRS